MLGYVCAVEALILSGLAYYPQRRYRQVPNDDESDICIQERELSPMCSTPADANHHNMKRSISDVPNHHKYNQISAECNQTPYIPGELQSIFFKRIPSISIYENTIF